MADDRKYVRVYYSIVDDDRFAEVYHDPRRLGTWLQLLLVADAMFPAAAPVPGYVHRPSFKALVVAGIVEERPHGMYVVHGLASERAVRSDSARNAAAKRWESGRNADPMPRQDEQRQDKTSRDDASIVLPLEEPEGEALTWLARHGCYVKPGNGYHQHLLRAVEEYGSTAVIGWFDRLARLGTHDGDVQGFIFGAKDNLDKQHRPNTEAALKEEREAERTTKGCAWVLPSGAFCGDKATGHREIVGRVRALCPAHLTEADRGTVTPLPGVRA